jgi:hypothetical protein
MAAFADATEAVASIGLQLGDWADEPSNVCLITIALLSIRIVGILFQFQSNNILQGPNEMGAPGQPIRETAEKTKEQKMDEPSKNGYV